MRYGTAVKSGSRRSLPKAPINKSTQNQWRKNHEHTAAVATRSPRREKGEIMAQQKFLVTGATGHTGGYTVEQLLERGHGVRALAHREDDRSKRLEKMGAEVVIGDFLKFNDVRAAMRGVRGAYFCYPIRPGILQATAYFAQAAKEVGLECVVNMSQKSAREDALSHAAQDHWLSEEVFDWSGITVTHLRDFRKTPESQTPLGRIGQTEDIALGAVFFASSDSTWITGETLLIAGGLR